MSVIGYILIVISIFSIIYHLITVICALLFRIDLLIHRKGMKKIKKWPKVVCFKPLCGEDKEGFYNFVSFMRIDYPNYMLLVGMADNKDPAFDVAQSMKRYFPYQIILSIGEADSGSNAKVRNMMHMEKYLPPDTEIVLISDSDVRVQEDYIKAMVLPFLNDPKVGATTCIYKVADDVELPEVIESLHVETNFVPSVLLAARFAPLRYAFGASIAIRMDVLKKIGGFDSVKDYLADDYMLAQKIIEAGYKIELAPHVVSVIPNHKSVKDALLHVIRWNRTIKVCNPIGYFFSAICYPSVWGVLTAFFYSDSLLATFLFLACTFTRISCAVLVAIFIDADIFKAVFTPVWDATSIILWLWALLGDKVKWRGREYKVLRDGRIRELE